MTLILRKEIENRFLIVAMVIKRGGVMSNQELRNQTDWSKKYDLKNEARLFPLKMYLSKNNELGAWEHLKKQKNKKQYLLKLILDDMLSDKS